jgi:hypothetical protein
VILLLSDIVQQDVNVEFWKRSKSEERFYRPKNVLGKLLFVFLFVVA